MKLKFETTEFDTVALRITGLSEEKFARVVAYVREEIRERLNSMPRSMWNYSGCMWEEEIGGHILTEGREVTTITVDLHEREVTLEVPAARTLDEFERLDPVACETPHPSAWMHFVADTRKLLA